MNQTVAMRPLSLTRHYLPHPEGSCLVELGNTRVITTATIELTLPQWLRGGGSGWITAEYGMLPRATDVRNRRPSGGMVPGRTMEIQRLIGRSLRASADLKALGERTITVDCDVINADGGTRVASIIGAAVALHDAGTVLIERGILGAHFMRELVAAVSVGMSGGEIVVDLDQAKDCSADVDMNVVMTESGRLVEVQGTAERKPFSRDDLNRMVDGAEQAINRIFAIQRAALELP